jgi:hypothetical protein
MTSLFNNTKSKKDKKAAAMHAAIIDDTKDKVATIVAEADSLWLKNGSQSALYELMSESQLKNTSDLHVMKLLYSHFFSQGFSDIRLRGIIEYSIQTIIKEGVMHELPLISAMSMVAVVIRQEGITSGVVKKDLESKLEKGDLDYKLASIILLILENAGVFKRRLKEGLANSYEIIISCIPIGDALYKYLSKHTSKEPSTYTPNKWSKVNKGGITTTPQYSGHWLKGVNPPKQSNRTWNVLNKLQSIQFIVNKELVDKHRNDINSTLPTMEEVNKIDPAVELYGEHPYYFSYFYGLDNGRIYSNGYIVPSQAGGRNWISQFFNKEVATDSAKKWLEHKLDGVDIKSLKSKKRLEYYNYKDALQKIEKGEPIGNMLGVDGINYGPQTIGLVFRCKTTYNNAIKRTFRKNAAKELNLSMDNIKGGESPYTYGAGKYTVIKGITDTGVNSSQIGDVDEFWSKWESLYEKYLPAVKHLRDAVNELDKKNKGNTKSNIDFTIPISGFNARITPTDNVKTMHSTVYGKNKEYSREENTTDFGRKVLAAFGHMLDSSILYQLVNKAEYAIKPVHDEYCIHPNNADKLLEDVKDIHIKMFREGDKIVSKYFSQTYKEVSETFNIDLKGFLINDMTEDDIGYGID